MASLLGGLPTLAMAAQTELGEAVTTAPSSANRPLKPATAEQQPPVQIGLQADEQGFDGLLDRFVARGDVQIDLAGGRLLADHLEYETKTRTLYFAGRVRFWRGEQYFQANSLRYSLAENRGDAEAVYGVVDFDTTTVDFDLEAAPSIAPPPLSYWPRATPFQASRFQLQPPDLRPRASGALTSKPLATPQSRSQLPGLTNSFRLGPGDTAGRPAPLRLRDWRTPPVVLIPAARSMACPPTIPPVPNWHPYPTAITAWGYGQSIDANFGDTFYFNGRLRPEYLWGFNVNQRLIDAGPLALEFDSNALLHQTAWQAGGEFNNTTPYAPLPPQTFGEFTAGLGLRTWLQPWLSLGFVQGVSLLTSNSLYEQTFRQNYQPFLNYLGFEVEALIKPQWSLVGRLHHRSGAYGTYGGVSEGSNAYLVGLRYRLGDSQPGPYIPEMPAPQGCFAASTSASNATRSLSEELNQVAMGPGGEAIESATKTARESPVKRADPYQEERERYLAILAAVDQRVSNLNYIRSLKLERRQGNLAGDDLIYGLTNVQKKFGQAQPQALLSVYGDQKLVDGKISRWRFQAEHITITPQGWSADRAAFTNDPFTPAQSWLDLRSVNAQQTGDGKTRISAKRSQLILENRLPIPLRRNLTLEQEKSTDNRFVVSSDSVDRSGVYFGYKLPEVTIPGTKATLKLEPQLLVARALNGSVATYPVPGSPPGADNGTQTAQIGDLFGTYAKLEGSLMGFAVSNFAASISTFNPQNFANGTRAWGDFSRSFTLPKIGLLPAATYTSRIYGAYRYRSFNGSLGYQDLYSAVGTSIESTGEAPSIGTLASRYFYRGSIGNYQGNTFTSTTATSQKLVENTRASFYGAINSTLPIWIESPTSSDPQNTQNAPIPITPGLKLESALITSLNYYGDGSNQNLISFTAGPTLTLGNFKKNFFDFTKLTITGGGALQQGQSPFSFDRNVDLANLGIGWTQQLFGPLMFDIALAYNVDPSSPFFGYTTNSYGELRWQRRGYEFAIYYSPYEQVGGLRIKLNDFNFDGTGVPFVPTTPFNPTRNRQSLF